MKRILTLVFLTLFVITFNGCSRKSALVVEGRTMGTWYTVKVYDADPIKDQEEIRQAINSALDKVNSCLNTYDPNSEISRFNDYTGDNVFKLSERFMLVSRTADMIYKKSGGAFDPTVKKLVQLWGFGDNGVHKKPDAQQIDEALASVGMNKLQLFEGGILKKDPRVSLDYSSIAKGYGVDLVTEELASLGYENILVEIGGEVRTMGRSRRIGIAVPDDNNIGNQMAADVITLEDQACATSGDYQQFYIENGERYSHLIDPGTGYPIKHDVTSVTVVSDNCMLADAVATAAIVLGRAKGLDLIEALEGVEAFFIYRDGDMLKSVASSGWKW